MENKTKYSQVRAMMSIARASLTATFRSPSAVVFTLAFPLVFIVVFGFVGGGGFKVHVGVSSNSDKENPVYQALDHIEAVRLIPRNNDSVMMKDLSKGDLDAAINIHKEIINGQPSYTVDLTTSSAAMDKGSMFRLILKDVADALETKMAPAYKAAERKPVIIKAGKVEGKRYKSIDFILPGQLGFSLLSTGVFGTAFVFMSLRQTLVLKRFFATPISRTYILLGEALARLIFALIGALIIIGIGYFAFGFTLIHGFSTLLQMLVLSAIGLIVFMGFGFTISGIAKNEGSIPPLANIVTLPQFLLSGTFFSIDNFPNWLQPIARALPLTYMNDAMRKVAFEGVPLTALWMDIAVMLLWGVIVYVAAGRAFKWE